MLMTRNDIIEIKKNSKWSNSEISKKDNHELTELTELTNDICNKMEKTLQMIAYIKNKQMKEV